jgi:anti-sigma-K factor RskA
VTCDQFSELYELYALGVLEGSERQELESHLGQSCENCMMGINRAIESNALIFGSVPKLEPPSGLRSRVLASFGLETRPFWVRAVPWSIACVALLALLMSGTYPPRQNFVVEFLATPGTRQVSFGTNGPHGSVLMQEQKGMLLVVVNLPAAPPGKMYETWIVPRTGAPKPVGQLKASKDGDAVGQIPGPLDMATIQAVAVSVELAGSSPVTPATVIFAAPLSGN